MNLHNAKKVLVLRFSSIGDILLTTPIVRLLASVQGRIVHFLTKRSYAELLDSNPHIHQIFTFDKDIGEVTSDLKNEDYDLIIDLHKNLRTKRLIATLRRPSIDFDKANIKKWMVVNLKRKSLHIDHIVDRYLSGLSLKDDGEGLEYFINEDAIPELERRFAAFVGAPYVVVNVGATYFTKRIPVPTIQAFIQQCNQTIVLIGGDDVGGLDLDSHAHLHNLIGQTTLTESAYIIKHAKVIITGDSGMMHLGAAYKVPMVVMWGSTVPEFGMYPYYGSQNVPHANLEVSGLGCRPCSKLGKNSCPKGHFRCMRGISVDRILASVTSLIE